LHRLTTSLSKVLQALRRFSMELNKPQARWQESQISPQDPALAIRTIFGGVDPLSDRIPGGSVAAAI
jgi:hypothetical protein